VLGSPFKVTVLPQSVLEIAEPRPVTTVGSAVGNLDLVDAPKTMQTTETMMKTHSAAAATGFHSLNSLLYGRVS